MAATLRHRVPADAGLVLAPELGVYAAWVAHPGSYAARNSSPAVASTPGWVVAGECFGRELAGSPAPADESFITDLNGLFAALLVDRQRRRAVLFNDRFASERLYTSDKDGATYFASEAKALLAVLPELRAFDDEGIAQWLAFGSTLHGRTLFRGVTLMPGGSVWCFEPGAPLQRRRYFEPSQWEGLPTLPCADFEARLSQAFPGVLRNYLDGGRRVGLSLTGGLDTRMIAACLPHDTLPAVAYTYADEGNERLLDLKIARCVAGARGIAHHTLSIGQEFVAQFDRWLDRTVWISDGTAGVLGAHELPLSEQAQTLAPVRLTGNFGSEVLRGMSTFKRNGPCDELLDPALAVRVEAMVAAEQSRSVHPVTHAVFEEVPWHLFGTLAVSRSLLTVRTPFMDNRIVELAYRAPAPSRNNPHASLRLIHDHDPALAEMPTDRGVAWNSAGPGARWRRLAAQVSFKLDYWHKDGLPDWLWLLDTPLSLWSHLGGLGRHKFLAYRSWFRGALAPHAAQVIGDARTRELGFWSPNALRAIASDHASGRRNRLRDIHAVLTLEAIQRLLLDARQYREHASATAP